MNRGAVIGLTIGTFINMFIFGNVQHSLVVHCAIMISVIAWRVLK